MPIKIIAITTMDGIFSISSIFKLYKCITRRPRWYLQIDVGYRSILAEQIFHFSLANVARQIPDVNGPARAAAHLSLRKLEDRSEAEEEGEEEEEERRFDDD